MSLDLDFICLDDISYLMEVEIPEIGMVKEGSGIFNGGLVVIGKEVLQSSAYMDLLTVDHDNVNLPGSKRNKFSKDQKLYNWYFKNILQLPGEYNLLVPAYRRNTPCRLLHLIYKPLYSGGLKQLRNIEKSNNVEILNKFTEYYKGELA